jgi:signal transduction histidine kinase/CheY-like chemotaxis protein
MTVKEERDVVLARQRARQIAELLGFDRQDQTRVATAVSEIVRNAYVYAGGGRMELGLAGTTPPQVLTVRVTDSGPGIANLGLVLSGQYKSSTGMGVGLIGARRILDGFDVQSSPAGTTVLLKKILPRHTGFVGQKEIAHLVAELARQRPAGPFEEAQRQNQELLSTLDELRRRQVQLERLNGELEDTNRGVVALYAELDEKACTLRRADELKGKFLSDMSHEFRTPLNSIIALSRILADRIDGPLTEEQAKQVGLISGSARELLTIVDDLLDLAKVEAGKVEVRLGSFRIQDLFGALRGMLRPLLTSEAVRLSFEGTDDLPALYSDEAKVSQILRNFISNALKFTEHGEVTVSATADNRNAPVVVFRVRDTGIGIAPQNHERVFEEFSQVDGPLQRRVRGTGLGLPLTRKLAGLLGGRVWVESRLGAGSTFFLELPLETPAAGGKRGTPPSEPAPADPDKDGEAGKSVLLVEDNLVERLACEKYLRAAGYVPVVSTSLAEAQALLRKRRPVAIILDVALPDGDTWTLLAELKSDPDRAGIPVFMVTTADDEAKALLLGADAYCRKPLDGKWLEKALADRVGNNPERPKGGAP